MLLIHFFADVKPNVSEHGNMVIKNGRHPLVERVMKDQAYVANDTVNMYFKYLSDEQPLSAVNM